MMTPGDPRHGTYAGAVQHQKDGDNCRPCARAKVAYMRGRRKLERSGKCAMTEGRVPGERSGLGWPLRASQ